MQRDSNDNGSPVLVVDLDGTLLRSDMLHESFWSAFGQDWRSLFRSIAVMKHGLAALKEYLAISSRIKVENLSYDSTVIDVIKGWRREGGRAVLVTASDYRFAKSIAAHLGLFDEVYASDGKTNLKGERKANFLRGRFGENGFVYVGDSESDLPVWRISAKAITVNASRDLRQKANASCSTVEHIATKSKSAKPYFLALRPHQWLKNILIFLPMLAGHQFDSETLLSSILAFVCFCLVASCVYVLNDLLDLEADRAHPRKKNRPFASGSIPVSHGAWLAAMLLVIGVFIAAVVETKLLLVIAPYFALTSAYSLGLKRLAVVDVFILGGLYTSRIVAGGVATGIPLSVWLLAFSSFFFLSLAAAKRQAELVDNTKRGKYKAAGRSYYVDDLPVVAMISVSAGYVSVLVMALYINSPAVTDLYSQPAALWGVCIVLLYWVTRIALMTHRGEMHDDPVVFAAKDPTSIVCLFVISGAAFVGALL